jgi:hypothetical protein
MTMTKQYYGYGQRCCPKEWHVNMSYHALNKGDHSLYLSIFHVAVVFLQYIRFLQYIIYNIATDNSS